MNAFVDEKALEARFFGEGWKLAGRIRARSWVSQKPKTCSMTARLLPGAVERRRSRPAGGGQFVHIALEIPLPALPGPRASSAPPMFARLRGLRCLAGNGLDRPAPFPAASRALEHDDDPLALGFTSARSFGRSFKGLFFWARARRRCLVTHLVQAARP